MMAESLNFYGRQFIKQGRLWLKFGVILHHWTVIWFFIENKVRICWFQLQNLHEIIFMKTKIMGESLYFYGRQFVGQGFLWQKFGVILHHGTVLWFLIENKARICWFQLQNLHESIFMRTKIMVEFLFFSSQLVCWWRWLNFWWSTFLKRWTKTKTFYDFR